MKLNAGHVSKPKRGIKLAAGLKSSVVTVSAVAVNNQVFSGANQYEQAVNNRVLILYCPSCHRLVNRPMMCKSLGGFDLACCPHCSHGLIIRFLKEYNSVVVREKGCRQIRATNLQLEIPLDIESPTCHNPPR